MDNQTATKTIRDKAIKRANINADAFSVDQTTLSVVIDLQPFINNKAIQVNALTGTLTMELSLDGVNFSNSSTPSTGITSISVPCRYVKLTISNTVGNSASGLVAGSIY